MMQNLTIATTAAAMLAATATAQVPLPPATQVSGQWIVDYADNACKAQLEIHLGPDRWIVTLEPTPASDEMMIGLLAPKNFAPLDAAKFLVGGQPIKEVSTGLMLQATTAKGDRYYQNAVFAPDFARLLSSETLAVRTSKKMTSFNLPKLKAVQLQLDNCVSDLLVHWGYPAETQAKFASFPSTVGPILTYFTDRDYPSAAVGVAGGNTTIRVNVKSDGHPEKCLVMQSSGRADLDEATCAVILKRVRFSSARDRAGNPIEAPYVATIRWRTF